MESQSSSDNSSSWSDELSLESATYESMRLDFERLAREWLNEQESEFTQTGSTLVDQHFYHLCQKNPQFHDLSNRRLIDRLPNRILTSQNVNVKFIK